MRALLFGLLLLAWITLLASAVRAAPPARGDGSSATSAPSAKAQPGADPGEAHLPIQAYYHASFFAQPWRLPGQARRLLASAGAVAGLDALLVCVLVVEARRRFGKGPAGPSRGAGDGGSCA